LKYITTNLFFKNIKANKLVIVDLMLTMHKEGRSVEVKAFYYN